MHHILVAHQQLVLTLLTLIGQRLGYMIIGVILYSLFWISLYAAAGKISRNMLSGVELHYISGLRTMIVWLAFSSMFVHYFEKSFVSTPIFMMLCGVGGALITNQNQRNE